MSVKWRSARRRPLSKKSAMSCKVVGTTSETMSFQPNRWISAESGVRPSHWRDCHFADTLSPSLLKYLMKVEGGAAE